ncbi:nucleoside diphosphate kinase regulator [Thalassospira lucentensis]|uniref:nucleoside diphosphate kinase regulator n=1 Tax=Thalassospira lucentensis TaxID=168935 RepID=UPI00142D29B8|nr:nucleoside diphosphate kinase regulator [Thalassospira lucentensis]NIZ03682.1 nucleoside diphosphate kinase regulator [Thalassospira lucentensis]
MHDTATTFAKAKSGDPAVFIDQAIADQLENLALANIERQPLAANRLLEEIDRAKILARSELPPDIITIGSNVTFRDNATGNAQTVTLVMPTEADITRQRISIMTPVGAALIGIAKGDTIWWQTPDKELRELTITDVVTPENSDD